jgi:hypothetical protein
MLYGWIYPQLMMVQMIMVTYACFSPLLMPLGALFFALETNYWIVMALVFLWRAIVLAKVKIPKESILWTQTMNILTCTLLLLTMLVIKISPWIFS